MSNFTNILTGSVDLKRNTSLLVDPVVIAGATLTLDRQPIKVSRLEIEVEGSNIVRGMVVVLGDAEVSVPNVVVQDRVTTSKWALTVEDGQLHAVETAQNIAGDPIVQDRTDSTKWAVSVESGQIIIRSVTEDAEDEQIIRGVLDTDTHWNLFVDQGQAVVESRTNTSEVFNFTKNGCKAGISNFSTIVGITHTGLTGGTISIRAVNKMGQPINQKKTVSSAMAVRFYAQDGKVRVLLHGQDKVANYRMLAGPTEDVQDGDLIFANTGVFGMTMGEVVFSEKIYDFAGATHHTEADVRDL